jgi:hypothetical protein
MDFEAAVHQLAIWPNYGYFSYSQFVMEQEQRSSNSDKAHWW